MFEIMQTNVKRTELTFILKEQKISIRPNQILTGLKREMQLMSVDGGWGFLGRFQLKSV